MARRDLLPWLLAGLGGAIILAVSQRKTIMLYGQKAVDAAHSELFGLQLPSYARGYAGIIVQVANAEGVDASLIFALGDRESNWGSLLSPRGPSGTGDYGHGRGLLQIDDRDPENAAILASGAWMDPLSNVRYGVQLLKKKLAFFQLTVPVPGLTDGVTVTLDTSQAARRSVSAGDYPDPRPLGDTALWQAAIAAYNTGVENVLMNLVAGKAAEFTTTGGNYVADVSTRAAGVASKYDSAAA